MSRSELDRALDLITEIPDFPEPGVIFRDLTPMFADGTAFVHVVDALNEAISDDVDRLVAVEARGFVLAAALGYARRIGVALVRKPGKLPNVADRIDYQLEYGTATLELPVGSVKPGERVAVVDDVLATGGTVAASVELIRRAGADVTGIAVVLELAALGGRSRLDALPVHALRTI
ncbi:adenine phosphoribosyltransferase [Saccharomonospora viridis]|uniref:Adenine phosphoribosyltransferase n=2 Tax=Saccharomonospora viridis TaxID=1852 RepID=C7MR01_SACVD|nr:adenine phosphoribosyltransferase [Saccharomonospora viridis]ACU96547.1 adenine phosphoribosyltransferase [Saccharomonospora viridis DSM 43017]KHF42690.1 adenine phosphoribosyltransferase [Saccharomonospora viridis]SFO93836.1 adenine phosphoribosyltransferase [Saccharomonospora viridis]